MRRPKFKVGDIVYDWRINLGRDVDITQCRLEALNDAPDRKAALLKPLHRWQYSSKVKKGHWSTFTGYRLDEEDLMTAREVMKDIFHSLGEVDG